jgi:hypothetical protein
MTIYPNLAVPGDYPAVFRGTTEVKFPKGPRLSYAFLILNEDRSTPQKSAAGDDQFAVAICNVSDGNNPKSKPYKIRRAMLEADEYDPIDATSRVPPAEYFLERHNGAHRVIEVRVACKKFGGGLLALVTHIGRPRDGEWECIEGKYEGPKVTAQRFRWLLEDGRSVAPDPKLERAWGIGPTEGLIWMHWNQTTEEQLNRWKNPNGALLDLAPAEFKQLNAAEKIRYLVARAKLGLDPLCYGEINTW